MIYLFVAIAFYLSAFIAQVASLKNQTRTNRKLILMMVSAGVLFHAITAYSAMISPQGVDFGFYKMSSMVALFFSFLVVVSAISKPIDNLLLALLPVSIFALLIAQLLPSSFEPKLYGAGVLAHIIISILAYSIMTISATHAILILLQDRQLKSHHPGGMFWGLPPLQTMEKLLWEMLVVGMVGLTLAIITGLIYLEDIFAQHLLHKTILTILAWSAYAVLLIGHVKNGWRGRVAARWTLSAFALLLIAFMGSKFVLELILQ